MNQPPEPHTSRTTIVSLVLFSAIAIIAVSLWQVTSREVYRSVMLQLGDATLTRDAAATAYVSKFPTAARNRVVEQLMVSPEFKQLQSINQLKDRQRWLDKHLTIRPVQGDRLEIIARARSRDIGAGELDSVVALVTNLIEEDAAAESIPVKVISSILMGE